MTNTLAEWLWCCFGDIRPIEAARAAYRRLDQDTKDYWEHEAAAVRRVVERNGFKGIEE